MRAIAHEMGLTTGVITHYFTDKDQLLLEVLQTCFTPWRQTIEQGKGCKSAWEQLRHLFFSTLPSYHQPRARVQVWLGMLLQIEKDPALLRAYKENYDLIRDEVFELIRQCQNDGLIHAGLDPVLEGNRLFALSDGLVVSVLGEPEIYTQEVVAQMMELQFAALQP
jgi:AcrR family transcriptional regulator